jgi:hypothetical protein
VESGVKKVGPVRARRNPDGLADDGDLRIQYQDEEKDRED